MRRHKRSILSLLIAILGNWLFCLAHAGAMTPLEASQYSQPTGSSGYAKDADVQGLWNLSEPIRIFVAPLCKGVPCKHKEAFIWALEAWRLSTAGLFSYKLCENPRDAKVHVVWSDRLPAGAHPSADTMGVTELDVEGVGASRINDSATVTVTVPDQSQPQYLWEIFQNVCIHEAGHLLGIYGHSPNRNDIMYASCSAKSRLSSADVDTLLYLYKERESLRHETQALPAAVPPNKETVSVAPINLPMGNMTNDYMTYVGKTVQEHWNPPNSSARPLVVSVRFTVNKDGQMTNIQFASNNIPAEYMRAASAALNACAPFAKPAPEVVRDWGKDQTHIDFDFQYVPPGKPATQ